MQEEEGFSCTEVSGIHLVSAEHLGLVGFTLNGPQNITKKKKSASAVRTKFKHKLIIVSLMEQKLRIYL